MKILITGGAGFIGSNIADLLIEENHEVIIIDNFIKGKRENINIKAKIYQCDVQNKEDLKKVFYREKPEVVIHNAAQIDVQFSLKKPNVDANINIVGTINILECCKEYGIRKIIYPSSAAVYGDPIYLPIDEKHNISPVSFYGISKYTPEYYIKVFSELYKIKYTIFRYSNVYGVRQDPKGEGGVIAIFTDKFLNKKVPIIFGDGEQTRDFIYVKDVAMANLLALTKGDNEIINISTGKCITINKLFEIMREICQSDIVPKYEESRNGEILNSYLCSKKAFKVLGWKDEYSIEEGLKELLDYYSTQYLKAL